MSKRFTKIICGLLSTVVVCGVFAVAGCDSSVTDDALSDAKGAIFTGDVVSNGGFAVEKGNYIYFINGIQGNSANNDYGTPVRGAIYRIAKSDYAARNYLSAECVVPLIAYAGNYTAGLYIYGDQIYYSTPSTVKNAEGEVQYDQLEIRSTKLDRSQTSAHYTRFEKAPTDFRFVQGEDEKVYLLYVTAEEKLYNESTGVKNIHSLDLASGTDKLLAYNVDTCFFDTDNLENGRVYYTMNVYDYSVAENTSYNQVYTVTADAPEISPDDRYGDLSKLVGWQLPDEEANTPGSIYKNSGTLVFDGVGPLDKKLPFNYPANKNVTEGADKANTLTYKYTIKGYRNGNLLYNRTSANNSSATDLYILNDNDYLASSATTKIDNTAYKTGFNPIDGNAQAVKVMDDGSNAANYKYLYDGNGKITAALISESNGGITINKLVDGKFGTDIKISEDSNYYTIVPDVSASLLFVQGEYLYYSVSGGNGYTINRVKYGEGGPGDYEPWQPSEGENSYPAAVKILDIDASNDWYMPEIIQNQLMFASAASDMSSYNYVMVCDLRSPSDPDVMMSNAEIRKLNDLLAGIEKVITGDKYYGNTELYPSSKYANLQNALRYVYYSGDKTYYTKELQAQVNEGLAEDADKRLSDETLAEINKFFTPGSENPWGKYEISDTEKVNYGDITATVNGATVYANMREYYYSVIGKMTDEDIKARNEYLQSEYGIPLPEEETEEKVSWFNSLSAGWKACFIIGVIVGSLLVIGGVAYGVIWFMRRKDKKKREDAPKRRRIKVDTTDDKSVDVYNVDGDNE